MTYKVLTPISIYPVTLAVIAFVTSCSILEKASVHGLTSGYYRFDHGGKTLEVYADVSGEDIDLYSIAGNKPESKQFISLPLNTPDSLLITPVILRKRSCDIDITSVLLKYRSSVNGLPPQLTTEFNTALYSGFRYDNFKISGIMDPLGKSHHKISTLGYDVGFFIGPGVTLISPFTTNNKYADEYSGMIIQAGIGGFLESHVASFGIAIGYDYLLNRDRDIWIYNKKPWFGFIVGIALN